MSEIIDVSTDTPEEEIEIMLSDMATSKGRGGDYEILERETDTGVEKVYLNVRWAAETTPAAYLRPRSLMNAEDRERLQEAIEQAGYRIEETDSGALSIYRDFGNRRMWD